MQSITNAKIEKAKADITKTKAKITEIQAKLRGQERHLKSLEDLEIVAQFRKEKFSDDNYAAIGKPLDAETRANQNNKEELFDDTAQNQ